jgi:ABC-2 type transport system permease protein
VIESGGVLAIAQRDVTKLFRDRARIFTDVLMPVVVFGLLGAMLNFSFGRAIGYDFLAYTLTGIFAQSLWQSATMGMIFLLEDRENDFSQEIFVSPISRYTIVIGKIVGESLVALPQGLAALLFLILVGFRLHPAQLLGLAGATALICLLGGSFGLLVLGWLPNRRVATQIFGFLMIPQYFLAGVFNPVKGLPAWLDAIAHLAPLRYAVDLARNVFYAGRPEAADVITQPLWVDVLVIAVMLVVFLPLGTLLFVRAERNR